MAWTQAQLVAAFNALSPVPATLVAGATTLNAQITTLTQPAADIGLGDIQGILLLNGDWLKIQQKSAGTATGASTDPVTVSQLAIQLVQSRATSVAAANWPTFLEMLDVLQSNSVISSASVTAITALAVMSQPTWSPAVQVADLQNLQRQGLITSATVCPPWPGYVGS